jgi:hypothetical protein
MSLIRGVLLAGAFRTQAELNAMSVDDHRNTLIVEMVAHSNQPVGHFQSLDDPALAGVGAVMVFLREARIRTDAELKTMSTDDQRNTLIVELNTQTGRPGPELQAMANIDLVVLGLGGGGPLLRGVLLAGNFRTQRELNAMSSEDHRNTLIVELVNYSNHPTAHVQSLDNSSLADAGAVMVFFRKGRIRTPEELKTMSLDDQRNTLIVELHSQTGRPVPELQSLSNGELVLLGLEFPRPNRADIERAKSTLEAFYLKHGGLKGPFGLRLSDPEINGDKISCHFAGGTIDVRSLLSQPTPRGTSMRYVQVRFVGLKSLEESNEWSESDEPYFLIGVAGTGGSTLRRFGPYGDVDEGETRFEAQAIADLTHRLAPPIVLGVLAKEHDEGTPEESEAKVRAVFRDIEDKVDEIAAGFGAVNSGSHVMPEWLRDIVIGWIPEGAAAVLGMGDDDVGNTAMILFDSKAELKEWRQYPTLGVFGPNEYTHVLTVGDSPESEGKYELYFHVQLRRLQDMPEP